MRLGLLPNSQMDYVGNKERTKVKLMLKNVLGVPKYFINNSDEDKVRGGKIRGAEIERRVSRESIPGSLSSSPKILGPLGNTIERFEVSIPFCSLEKKLRINYVFYSFRLMMNRLKGETPDRRR